MKSSSFTPLIAVFGTSFLITITLIKSFQIFMGISISLLAMLKLMDIEAFGVSFKKYDLISSRFNSWIYIYPFCELLIGINFLLATPPFSIILLALILGITGMVSVFKAVYLDKLKLNCACVGGYAQTPLGIISFIENLLMAIMSSLILFDAI
ncbi:MAG: MauE/DoxX family redox-associated membrane protein [Prochlorococcus marinus]|tara:strand:+ start:495 stop:953 length:459 start_codon:yes stop_codon:yes gene_type:complete